MERLTKLKPMPKGQELEIFARNCIAQLDEYRSGHIPIERYVMNLEGLILGANAHLLRQERQITR